MIGSSAIPEITAVIVNHNDWPAVLRQLHAYWLDDPEAFAAIDWRIVDNGWESPIAIHEMGISKLLNEIDIDGSLPSPARRHVRVIRTVNADYGTAINEVLRSTSCRFVLALNADLIPMPGFLNALNEIAHEGSSESLGNRKIALRGAKLLHEDGSWQGTAGRFPNLVSLLAGLFRPRDRRKYLHAEATEPTAVPWVTGACILIDRECLKTVGDFDERYFMYYEDVDLCKRLAVDGFVVAYEPRLSAKHLKPYHSRPLTVVMVYWARHGLLRYFYYHRPRWEFHVLAWIMRFECRYRGFNKGWEKVDQMVHDFSARPAEFRFDPNLIAESNVEPPS